VAQSCSTNYAIHEFKDFVGPNNTCTLEWEGQSNVAPSDSPVYLQIYNRNTDTWDPVDSDNLAAADTDFILTKFMDNLANYKSAGNIIACRVYQQIL